MLSCPRTMKFKPLSLLNVGHNLDPGKFLRCIHFNKSHESDLLLVSIKCRTLPYSVKGVGGGGGGAVTCIGVGLRSVNAF